MPITFPCPHCGQELTAPDEAAGQSGKCRFCNAVIQAPAAPDLPPGLVQPGNVAPLPPGPGAESTYAEPPAYQMGYPSAPVGEVRPGLIFGEAWQVTTNNWGILTGATVLSYGVMLTPFFFIGLLAPLMLFSFDGSNVSTGGASTLWWIAGALLLALIASLPAVFGVYGMVIELLTTGQTALGTMFAPYRRFGRLWATLLPLGIASLPLMLPAVISEMDSLPGSFGSEVEAWWSGLGPAGVLAMVALYIAGVYLLISLMWAPLEVLDRNAAPADALRESWGAVQGKRIPVFFAIFLLGLVNTIGSYCCIGALFTTPLLTVGTVITYRQLRGLEGNIV